MPADTWRPGADIETLKARGLILAMLRAFFDSREYLEVETPCLNQSGTVDPNVESIWIEGGRQLLHTSPEFAMKRLLAAGSGPIYQICRVFRADECGRLHNAEFTMLEWYKPGFDHWQLMDEIESLLVALGVTEPNPRCSRLTYQQAFERALGINPFQASHDDLGQCVTANGIAIAQDDFSRDDYLDLLMGHCVAPGLGKSAPEFVYDYPASQAALARISSDNPAVAERFELFWQGVELANGFHELADATEQRERFSKEQSKRAEQGKKVPPVDTHLLTALEHGLPDCAGVALGIDRLLMLKLQKSSIDEVMAFSQDRT